MIIKVIKANETILPPTLNKYGHPQYMVYIATNHSIGSINRWEFEIAKLIDEKTGNDNVILIDGSSRNLNMSNPDTANRYLGWKRSAFDYAANVMLNFSPLSKSQELLIDLGMLTVIGQGGQISRPFNSKLNVICPKECYLYGQISGLAEMCGFKMYEDFEEAVNSNFRSYYYSGTSGTSGVTGSSGYSYSYSSTTTFSSSSSSIPANKTKKTGKKPV